MLLLSVSDECVHFKCAHLKQNLILVSGSQDYADTTAPLLFDATTSEDCVNVPILVDMIVEDPVEFFIVRLSSTDPAAVFVRTVNNVIITDTTRK